MIIQDLGSLSGPVVLWGGALGNLAALDALERVVDHAGVVHAISTGDAVGYCAEGADCVARLRMLGWPGIAGNVERQLGAGAGHCGCGFEAGSLCDRLSAGWWRHADRTIGEAARDWMAKLPDMLVFTHENRRYAVIHGGVTHISRFLWQTSRQEEFAAEIAVIEAAVGPVDGVIAGHSGLTFQRIVAGRHWINAGVIGMPPNNGVPGGQYVRLDGSGAHILRLSYDATPSVHAMKAAGLTQGYDQALMDGYWPSQDVLPEALRRRRPVSGPVS